MPSRERAAAAADKTAKLSVASVRPSPRFFRIGQIIQERTSISLVSANLIAFL